MLNCSRVTVSENHEMSLLIDGSIGKIKISASSEQAARSSSKNLECDFDEQQDFLSFQP